MMASLFAGVSGLRNHQVKMNVIANNIANINTIGFKTSRVNFQEALVQTYKGAGRPSSISGGTNPIQLGLGMQVGTIDNLFQQGGLELTGQITDLALQGSGFFILGDTNDNKFYTRAGAFGFDGNSNMVDLATGLYVLGKMADSSGEIPSLSTIGQITLPFGQQDPARATETVWLANNLNAGATDSDIIQPIQAGSSNVTVVSGTAVDGVGGRHVIAIAGSQAQQASYTSARSGLGLTNTLGSVGITDISDWILTVDGSRVETISGFTTDSTIEDLISSINQILGLSAELTATGEVKITCDKAGSPADYSFVSSASAAGNIVDQIFTFGSPPGTTFTSAGGAATTFVTTDTFTPNKGTGDAAGPVVTTLDLVISDETGLVTGLSGLGGGGVQITAGISGLSATGVGSELIIDTADTLHTTSINVFDSQGGRHTLSIEFFKSVVPNRWEWTVNMLGTERIVSGGTGYVMFNPDASLNTFVYNGGVESTSIDPNSGADNISVTFNAGTAFNFDGLTGFATGTHTASIIRQDGYGLGILEKIAIDQMGNISGIFSNGINRVLAQILLADFTNQAGLRKAGKSMYQVTANSGAAIEGVAGSTISGQIFSGALESSSVDIAQEFTGMITAQRGFQANARIITTSDSLLDELVNIKR